MSNNPHFYKKLGFNYIENDSPPEMIVDLYKDKDSFNYIYTYFEFTKKNFKS